MSDEINFTAQSMTSCSSSHMLLATLALPLPPITNVLWPRVLRKELRSRAPPPSFRPRPSFGARDSTLQSAQHFERTFRSASSDRENQRG
jgi:hypothetical protein